MNIYTVIKLQRSMSRMEFIQTIQI